MMRRKLLYTQNLGRIGKVRQDFWLQIKMEKIGCRLAKAGKYYLTQGSLLERSFEIPFGFKGLAVLPALGIDQGKELIEVSSTVNAWVT